MSALIAFWLTTVLDRDDLKDRNLQMWCAMRHGRCMDNDLVRTPGLRDAMTDRWAFFGLLVTGCICGTVILSSGAISGDTISGGILSSGRRRDIVEPVRKQDSAQPNRGSKSEAIRLVAHSQRSQLAAAEPSIRRLPPLTGITTAESFETNPTEPSLIVPGNAAVPLAARPLVIPPHNSQQPVDAALGSSVAGSSSSTIDHVQPIAAVPISVQRSISSKSDDLASSEQVAFDRQEMAVTTQRAHGHIQNGIGLAARGALFSARNEFVRALRVVADALDARNGTDEHSTALRQGLRALDEAEDFMSVAAEKELDIDVTTVLSGHRTTVCNSTVGDSSSGNPTAKQRPFSVREALDAYYRHANQSLAQSAGGLPVASAALFGLGKVHASLASLRTEDRAIHEYRATALYQSSLAVDGRNSLAANELGVLMARYGRHDSAVQLFQQSLAYQNDPNVWRNLSVAMSHLGYRDLAQEALQRAGQTGPSQANHLQGVQWLDNSAFAATARSTDVARQPIGATSSPLVPPLARMPQTKPASPRHASPRP